MKALFMLLRHLVAILVLPFVVTIVIPRWVVAEYGLVTEWSSPGFTVLGRVAGGLVVFVGLSLFGWCLYLFAARGKGTLAPWDPPRHLVVTGPYQYVRNPMISGVLFILAGEALYYGSQSLGLWFLIFLAINQAYFVIIEEPMLEARFGEEYRRYKNHVPRWLFLRGNRGR